MDTEPVTIINLIYSLRHIMRIKGDNETLRTLIEWKLQRKIPQRKLGRRFEVNNSKKNIDCKNYKTFVLICTYINNN